MSDPATQTEVTLEQTLRLDPRNAKAWAQLGQIHAGREQTAAAIQCLMNSIAIEPQHADVHTSLASALLDAGDLVRARAHCRRALELDETCTSAHFTLGNVAAAQKRFEEAIECFQSAIRLDPACPAARTNMGSAFYLLGRHSEARSAFEQALRLKPDDALARHMVGALGGAPAPAAPRDYVRDLFDEYAATFDQHLINELGYQTPARLADLVREVRPVVPNSLDILDLGCGTGLAGLAVHPWARCLAGVDLSPKMLQIAARRAIYQRLTCNDLLAALSSEPPGSFDLVLAADVLVYIGRLEEVFAEARRVLRPNGIFAFSVERLGAGEADYEVNETGRYAHSTVYLQRLAAASDFAADRQVECALRRDHGASIAGWIAAWTAIPTPSPAVTE